MRGIPVWVCALDDRIAKKRAAGRPKDRLMVEELAALREERDRLEAHGRDPDAGLPDQPPDRLPDRPPDRHAYRSRPETEEEAWGEP